MTKARKIAPSEDEIRQSFNDMVTEFVRVTDMSKSSIGLKALNDSNFVFRVEDGEDFTMRNYRRVWKFMVRNWPRDSVPSKRVAGGSRR